MAKDLNIVSAVENFSVSPRKGNSEALQKLIRVWNSKNAKAAQRIGTFGFMAATLAACGGGSKPATPAAEGPKTQDQNQVTPPVTNPPVISGQIEGSSLNSAFIVMTPGTLPQDFGLQALTVDTATAGPDAQLDVSALLGNVDTLSVTDETVTLKNDVTVIGDVSLFDTAHGGLTVQGAGNLWLLIGDANNPGDFDGAVQLQVELAGGDLTFDMPSDIDKITLLAGTKIDLNGGTLIVSDGQVFANAAEVQFLNIGAVVLNSELIITYNQFNDALNNPDISVTGAGKLTVLVTNDTEASDVFDQLIQNGSMGQIGSFEIRNDSMGLSFDVDFESLINSKFAFLSKSLGHQIDDLANTLQDQITTNEGDISTLAGRATDLEAALNLLKTIVEEGQGDLAGRLDTIEGQLEGITGTLVSYIEEQIGDLEDALQAQIDTNEGDISALAGRATQLETDLSALQTAVQGEGGLTDRLIAVEGQLEGITGTLVSYIEEQIGDLEDALQAQIDTNEGDISALAGRATQLETDLSALQTAVQGEGGLTDRLIAVEGQLEGITGTLVSYIEEQIGDLEDALQAQIDTNEGDISALSTALSELQQAVDALETLTGNGEGSIGETLAGLQTQINEISERLDALEAGPKNWVVEKGEDSGLSFTVAAIFGVSEGSATVLNAFISDFADLIEGYDAATVPLTVEGDLTVAQAVALAKAGFDVNGPDVTYSIRDVYTTVQSALTNPDANAALAGAETVVAFGNNNPNAIDMVAFGNSINLRIEGLGGNDTIFSGPGAHEIVGGRGADTIWLTDDVGAQDTVVYQTLFDGRVLPITTVAFSTDADDYRIGTTLTLTVNGTIVTYKITQDGVSAADAIRGFATVLSENAAVTDAFLVQDGGLELRILGLPDQRLRVEHGEGKDEGRVQLIENGGQQTVVTVTFPDLDTGWPTQTNGSNTTMFDREFEITITVGETPYVVSAHVAYNTIGEVDILESMQNMKAAIEQTAGLKDAVTVSTENATLTVAAVNVGANSISVTDANIDTNGVQHQSELTFSNNDADYYAGGTLRALVGGVVVEADMVAGNAAESIELLVAKLEQQIERSGTEGGLKGVVERAELVEEPTAFDATKPQVIVFEATINDQQVRFEVAYDPAQWSGNLLDGTGKLKSSANAVTLKIDGTSVENLQTWPQGQNTLFFEDGKIINVDLNQESGVNPYALDTYRAVFIENTNLGGSLDEIEVSALLASANAGFPKVTSILLTAATEGDDPLNASAQLDYEGELQQAILSLMDGGHYDFFTDGVALEGTERGAAIYFEDGKVHLTIRAPGQDGTFATDDDAIITITANMNNNAEGTMANLRDAIALQTSESVGEDVAASVGVGVNVNANSIVASAASQVTTGFDIQFFINVAGVRTDFTAEARETLNGVDYYFNGGANPVGGSDNDVTIKAFVDFFAGLPELAQAGIKLSFEGGQIVVSSIATGADVSVGIRVMADENFVISDGTVPPDSYITGFGSDAPQGSLFGIISGVSVVDGSLTLTAATPGQETFRIDDVSLDYLGVRQIATIRLDNTESEGTYLDHVGTLIQGTRFADVYGGGKVYVEIAVGENTYLVEALMGADAATTAANLAEAINDMAMTGHDLHGILAPGGAVAQNDGSITLTGATPDSASFAISTVRMDYAGVTQLAQVTLDKESAYQQYTFDGNGASVTIRDGAEPSVYFEGGKVYLEITPTGGSAIVVSADMVLPKPATLVIDVPGATLGSTVAVEGGFFIGTYGGFSDSPESGEITNVASLLSYFESVPEIASAALVSGMIVITAKQGVPAFEIYVMQENWSISDTIVSNILFSTMPENGNPQEYTTQALADAINDAAAQGGALEGIIASGGASVANGTITLEAANAGTQTFAVSDVRMDYQGVNQIAKVDFDDFTPFDDGSLSLTIQGTDANGNADGQPINFEADNIEALVAKLQAGIDGVEVQGNLAKVAVGSDLEEGDLLFSGGEGTMELAFTYQETGGTVQNFVAIYTADGEQITLEILYGDIVNDGYDDNFSESYSASATQGISGSVSQLIEAMNSAQENDIPVLPVVFSIEGGQLTMVPREPEADVTIGLKIPFVNSYDVPAIPEQINENGEGESDYFVDSFKAAVTEPGSLTGLISKVEQNGSTITLTSADNVKQQFKIADATASQPGEKEITTIDFSGISVFETSSDPDGTPGRLSITVDGNTYTVLMGSTLAATLNSFAFAFENGQEPSVYNNDQAVDAINPDRVGIMRTNKDGEIDPQGEVFVFTGKLVGVDLGISSAGSVDGVKQITHISLDGLSDADLVAGIGRDISVTIAGQTFTADGGTRMEVLEKLAAKLQTAIAADHNGEGNGISRALEEGGVTIGLRGGEPVLVLTARFGEDDPLNVSDLTRNGFDPEIGTNVKQEILLSLTGTYLNSLVGTTKKLLFDLGNTEASFQITADLSTNQIMAGIADALAAADLIESAVVGGTRGQDILLTANFFGPNVMGSVNAVKLIEFDGSAQTEIITGYSADEPTTGAIQYTGTDQIGAVLEYQTGKDLVVSDPLLADQSTDQSAKPIIDLPAGVTNPGFATDENPAFFGDAPQTGGNNSGIQQDFVNPDSDPTLYGDDPMSGIKDGISQSHTNPNDSYVAKDGSTNPDQDTTDVGNPTYAADSSGQVGQSYTNPGDGYTATPGSPQPSNGDAGGDPALYGSNPGYYDENGLWTTYLNGVTDGGVNGPVNIQPITDADGRDLTDLVGSNDTTTGQDPATTPVGEGAVVTLPVGFDDYSWGDGLNEAMVLVLNRDYADADVIYNFNVEDDKIAFDDVWALGQSVSTGSNDYARIELGMHGYGMVNTDISGLDTDHIGDATAVAARLQDVFTFGSAYHSDTLNATIFAVTASDDENVTAIWAHQQSSADDTTIDAGELYLLATVNTTGGAFSLGNFDILHTQEPL